jgi:hypothetical protein
MPQLEVLQLGDLRALSSKDAKQEIQFFSSLPALRCVPASKDGRRKMEIYGA